MIVQFNNDYLERLFEGKKVVGKPKYSKEVITKFKKAILKLANASNINELRKIRSLNFESLKGNLKGYYSVRVDYHYRLILTVENDEIKLIDVLIVEDLTNHYQ
jgi:plasmid maintenance system killer protein